MLRERWNFSEKSCEKSYVVNEAFLQSCRGLCLKFYTRKATQRAIITEPIFEGVMLRWTVFVRMICEICIQTLEQLMIKFSYVSQPEGYSLRNKTQGHQQKPWLNFPKFFRWEWRREIKKSPYCKSLANPKALKLVYRKCKSLWLLLWVEFNASCERRACWRIG